MIIVLPALAALLAQMPHPAPAVRVDASRVVNHITPWMIGSCIEDVNHEIYGGLYAQLIFGESFEEPPVVTIPVAGWRAFGGRWRVSEGALRVEPEAGAKLVRDQPLLSNGTVACDVRLNDDKGDNAGLILRVADPRTGADSWTGYEISVSYRNHAVILGRHKNNWTLLRSAPASIEIGRWHRLQVDMKDSQISVRLDGGGPVIRYDDGREKLAKGQIGIRTWNSNASFRNLVIDDADSRVQATDDMTRSAPPTDASRVSGTWNAFHSGDARADYGWDAENPYNSGHCQRIQHKGGIGAVGIVNQALNRWGISVRAGERFDGRLYVRQQPGAPGLVVALQSADGVRTYAKTRLRPAKSSWARQNFSLVSSSADNSARFAVWLDAPGTVWVDQAVLLPSGNALFRGMPIRSDIGSAMVDEGLKFLRYGGSMVNAPGYRWKQMIGDPDRRPQYVGTWYPQSTNGFGIEEFVRYCRTARIEPAFAVNIEETPDDAADLAEYLNSPKTTKWGARRAANGHPAPYGVRFIEIGNEETTNEHYIERFKLLEAAMHRVDPSLQLVIAAWWEPNNPISKRIVRELDGKAALWDVHIGGDDLSDGANVDALFTRMEQLVRGWKPGTSLKACVFEENGDRHDLQRAIGHAYILNATERHGDFVLMDCPANCLQPLNQNDNGWNQGQIFFTPDKVWGMPPYYAQQMAARNYLPLRVSSSVEGAPDLDVTATRSEDWRTLVLKVVHTGRTPVTARLQLQGFPAARAVDVWTLAGSLTAVNTPDQPEAIQWKQTRLSAGPGNLEYAFRPTSYTILRFHR